MHGNRPRLLKRLFLFGFFLACSPVDGRLVGTWRVDQAADPAGLPAASHARVLESVQRTLSTVQIELGSDGAAAITLGATRLVGHIRTTTEGDRVRIEARLRAGETEQIQTFTVFFLGDHLQFEAPDGRPLLLTRVAP